MSELKLIEAAKSGNVEAARQALEAGADVNEQDEHGWTALNWSAGRGDVPTIRLLLENGADVYRVGRDQRTAYLIALAAGRAEAMKVLLQAEAQAGGERASASQTRKYCKAYQLKQLRSYPRWPQGTINQTTGVQDADISDDEVVFVHQNYAVTQSPFDHEKVLFDQVTPEWREFCTEILRFKVPDDFDLVASTAGANDDAHRAGKTANAAQNNQSSADGE